MASSNIKNKIFPPHRFHLIINQLKSGQSGIRAEGATSFQTFLATWVANSNTEERHEVFQQSYIHLLNLLRDPSEHVRMMALKCINYFYINFLPKNGYYVTHLMPIMVERIGRADEMEQSKPVRCTLLTLLDDLLVAFGHDEMRQFAGKIIRIMIKALNVRCDMFTEICLKIINKLPMMCPIEMSTKGSKLLQPLLATLRHRSHHIRTLAVFAITEVAMVIGSECLELITDALRARVDDTSAEVRQILARFIGKWLLDHPYRYSYCHLFIPMLLRLLSDKSADNRGEAEHLWSLVGKKYYDEHEVEEEDGFKNYPPNVQRPSIGCRKMVQRYFSSMLQPIYAELLSDIATARFHCTKVIIQLVLHAEEGIVHYLPKIILAMDSAIRDENEAVRLNAIESVNLIGFFVPPHEWWPIIFPSLDENCSYAILAILGRLIKRCPGEMPSNVLLDIASTLATSEMCQTRILNKQTEIISCTRVLRGRYQSTVDAVMFSESIFNIIVSVVSINHRNHPYTLDLLDDLKRDVHIDDLWSVHTEQLLNRISTNPKTWHEDSPEFCIFFRILTASEELLFKHFEKIVLIVMRALDARVPARCRLQTFLGLEIALNSKRGGFEDAKEVIKEFMPKLILECFMPALNEQNDKLKTSATKCLEIVLSQGQFVDIFETDQQMLEIFNKLISMMQYLLNNEACKMRKYALTNLLHMKNMLVEKNKWTTHSLIRLYPDILLMMNDRESEVALHAIYVAKHVFEDLPASFNKRKYFTHYTFFVNALLAHLDNVNGTGSATILDILKDMAGINRKLMYREAKKYMNILRNKEPCRKLMHHCNKF